MLGLIGETLEDDDEITGAVVSIRTKGDRIAMWTKTAGKFLSPSFTSLSKLF